jgi:hypothetical protein
VTKSPRWITLKNLLIQIAAESPEPMTYGQIAAVMRWGQGVPVHRRHLGGMLRKVFESCTAEGVADLTAWVISSRTGQPGSQWAGWSAGDDPELVRKTGHVHYRTQVWGE